MNFSDWIDRELWGAEPEPVTINLPLVIVNAGADSDTGISDADSDTGSGSVAAAGSSVPEVSGVFKLPKRVVMYLSALPQYKSAATADLMARPYTDDCEFAGNERRVVVHTLADWIKIRGKFYCVRYLPGMSSLVTFWAANPKTNDIPAFTFEFYNDYLPHITRAIKHYGLIKIDDELCEILL